MKLSASKVFRGGVTANYDAEETVDLSFNTDGWRPEPYFQFKLSAGSGFSLVRLEIAKENWPAILHELLETVPGSASWFLELANLAFQKEREAIEKRKINASDMAKNFDEAFTKK